MFGLGPIELIVAFFMVGGMAFVLGLVIRALMRANQQPLRKCPHCGKDLPG